MTEQHLKPGVLPRHRHDAAYAALVLSGGYLEAGSRGRWRVEAGDVVAHAAFEAHQNLLTRGAVVLNLALDPRLDLPPAFRVADPDALVRAAREDSAAVSALMAPVETRAGLDEDWPDRLAADLNADPGLKLGDWARRRGLSPSTLARGFRSVFGVTPARYGAERRTLAAWRDIARCGAPLAGLACDHGFADQAHMTRAIVALTGIAPGVWRGRFRSRPAV